MKSFQRTPESSSIDGFEYDHETLVLEVEFKSGDMYRYLNVDKETFQELQEAKSKGSFIATRIKKLKFEKIDGIRLYPKNPHRYLKVSVDHGCEVSAAWPFPTNKKP